MSIHKAGQDIDSYCGKCKMTLAHVIVAMEGTKVARAQCKTCYATHAYRKDPALKAKKPQHHEPPAKQTPSPALAPPSLTSS